MWKHLDPVLRSNWLNAEGDEVPVWQGDLELPERSLLFRGCSGFDMDDAIQMLETPRFFAYSVKLANTYSSNWAGDPAGLKHFLITAQTVRPLALCALHMAPIITEVYANDGPASAYRDGIAQEFQRLKMTEICSYFGKKEYGGVFDNGGDDIIISEPMTVLSYEIAEI